MLKLGKIKVEDKVYTTLGIGRVTGIVKAKYSYTAFPEGIEFKKGETVYRIAMPPENSTMVRDMKRRHILRVM